MRNNAGMMFPDVNDAQDPVPALKRKLARAILDRLEPSGQLNVARRLGVDRARASNLQCGRLERFSLQQLVRFAARVDGDVSISVTWTSRRIWIIPRRGR
ncbi:MAG: helix-turn-helix domain-containing protein [Gemmatimonadota bacterium]|nr:helix-turn-helix domain-containing protein [Gemmatimonadota bacterium]